MITSDVSGTLLAQRCRKINSLRSAKGTDYINIIIQYVIVVVVDVVDDDDKYLIDNSFVSSFQKKNKFCSIEGHFAHSEYNSQNKYRLLCLDLRYYGLLLNYMVLTV